jgi:hypothetical protein
MVFKALTVSGGCVVGRFCPENRILVVGLLRLETAAKNSTPVPGIWLYHRAVTRRFGREMMPKLSRVSLQSKRCNHRWQVRYR